MPVDLLCLLTYTASAKPYISYTDLQWWCRQQSRLLADNQGQRFYFVHSYRATPSEHNKDWVLASSHYGEDFVAALQKGDTYATQFHPEKSGAAGLTLLKNFFESYTEEEADPAPVVRQLEQQHVNGRLMLSSVNIAVSYQYCSLHCCIMRQSSDLQRYSHIA